MKKILLVLIFFTSICNSQGIDPLLARDSENQMKWVYRVMKNMTLDEKIGQLFMVPAYSNKDKKHENSVKNIIKRYHVGGLIFMQGTAEKQIELWNYYQSKSKIPLLVGFDGEWGLDMRLKNTFKYPWNMTLGAVQDNSLIELVGKQIGKQCKRVGVHVNFAPVVDINTNPKNPVIGNRSFGENKFNVTQKAKAFIKGLQSEHVLANAKHFPGHGDTSTDSHKTLPTLHFERERLDSLELFPYKNLFRSGLASIMTAHLNVPSLTQKNGIPTSVSKNVITELLQENLQFKGLIFTDALNMKGATSFAKPGELDLAAFKAGNDILLFPENVGAAVKKIKKAIRANEISIQQLNKSVEKILKAKYLMGLHSFTPLKIDGLENELNSVDYTLLYKKLSREAITIVKNEKATLPIVELSNNKIAYIKIGDEPHDNFIGTLKKYSEVDEIETKNLEDVLDTLQTYQTVIIGFHKSESSPYKSYKLNQKELTWISEISKENNVILTLFASPYALFDIPKNNNLEGIIVAYQNNPVFQEEAAQLIFGAFEAKGKLPVSVGENFPEGLGIQTPNLKRLSYTIPEEVGLDSQKLKKIDSITTLVVDSLMAPGGQVLVARYGKVVYHKSFGFHTYEKLNKVKLTDMYDLASVTKILGGLPMIMKAEELNLISINSTLGTILPYLKGSNKDTITLKEALSHVGKIQAWIPYYLETIDTITKQPFKELYSEKITPKHTIKIAENLFLINSYTDTIYKRIADVPQRKTEGYKYSGLLFYLAKKYIQETFHERMDSINSRLFYAPLGASTLTYNPTEKFTKSSIAPTEKDTYYRHQLLQGYVHDMGAAMMGGVSGNAGLFGNSNDVAKMMQMYLQKGYYGGKVYFESKTIDKFNHRYYEKDSVRRGLGFDKPQLNLKEKATSKYASNNSFGHSGFTGTYVWADPDNGILYVFLSNRVHPTMENNKLGEYDIRTEIHNLIYEAIIEE